MLIPYFIAVKLLNLSCSDMTKASFIGNKIFN